MKVGYLLQVIVGVICDFFLMCITFPSLVVKQGVVPGVHGFMCGTIVNAFRADIVIKALCCAIHSSYGRNKGASWSKSKKRGACFDTLCFRSNSQGSQYFGNKRRKFRGACWWSKPTFSKISLGQFNCLWSLNMLEVAGFSSNCAQQFLRRLNLEAAHPYLLVMKTIEAHSPCGLPAAEALVVIYCMFLCYESVQLMWLCLVLRGWTYNREVNKNGTFSLKQLIHLSLNNADSN